MLLVEGILDPAADHFICLKTAGMGLRNVTSSDLREQLENAAIRLLIIVL